MTWFNYHLCGLHLRSAFHLPELIEHASPDGEAEIYIKKANLAESFENPDVIRPMYQIKGKDNFLMNIKEIAKYQALNGNEIFVDPNLDHDDPDIRVILFGTIFGVIFHQRGMLPLHASSVLTEDGQAVAFAGDSGMGKSSMAAWLTHRGHRLVSDDMLIVDPQYKDVPHVRPAFPRLKIWQDVLDVMKVSSENLLSDSRFWQRYQMRRPEGFSITPVPFKALYILQWENENNPVGINLVKGVERVEALRANVFRYYQARQMGYEAQMFSAVATLAQKMPVFLLSRPQDLTKMDEVTAMLRDHWKQLG